jgi:hypothetical protein
MKKEGASYCQEVPSVAIVGNFSKKKVVVVAEHLHQASRRKSCAQVEAKQWDRTSGSIFGASYSL